MSNIKNKIKNAKKNLPYQFVRIDTNKAETIKKRKLNEISGLTGSLQCTLQVLNGLIVGNEHDEKQKIIKTLIVEKDGNKHYFISPYTLKGCIRQFTASLSNIPMRKVENEAFFHRPNQYFKNNKDFGMAAGIVKKIKNDGSFEASLIKPPFCFTKKDKKDKDKNKIVKLNKEWNYKIKKGRKIKVLYQKKNGEKMRFVPYRDGIDGKGNFSELFGSYKEHDAFGYLIGNEQDENVTASASESIVEQYNAMPGLIIKYHLANHPNFTDKNLKHKGFKQSTIEKNIRNNWKVKEGDLILYEYDIRTNEILSFGKHFRYLWTYKNRIWDFDEVCIVDVENFKKDLLSVTDEMFGYSFSKDEKDYLKNKKNFNVDKKDRDGKSEYNTSKSGKIHFNFAKYVENSGIIDDDFKVPGTDSPHASSYEFYLEQKDKDNDNDILNNYGDRLKESCNSHLSGRKIYKRSTKFEKNIRKFKGKGHIGKEKTRLFQSKDNKIAKFKFTINFENLTKYELKLLLFALTLGKNKKFANTQKVKNQYCHQIGYAKNFGLGAVRILVDNIRIVKKNDDKVTCIKKNLTEYDLSNFYKKLNTNFDNIKLKDIDLFYPPKNGPTYKWHGDIRKKDHENRKKNYKKE